MNSNPTTSSPATAGSLLDRLKAADARRSEVSSAQAATALDTALSGIQQRTAKVAAADPSERLAQLNLAKADFASASSLIAQHGKDLVIMIEDYQALLGGLSEEHARLIKPNAEDLAEIAAAENAVTTAKANTLKTGFFASWTANSRKAALAEAESALASVRQTVQVRMRQRLKTANTVSLMEGVIETVRGLKEVLETRLGTTQAQLDASEAFRQKLQGDLQQLAQEADRLKADFDAKTQEVSAKQLELADAAPGAATAKVEGELAELRAQLQKIEADQTVINGTIRTAQTFYAEHTQQEKSLRETHSALRVYIGQLTVTLDNRAQTVSSMAELEKSFSDVEAAATMMNVDDQVSERQMARSATIGAAVQNQLQKDAESAPAKLAAKKKILQESLEQSRRHTSALQACFDSLKTEGAVVPDVAAA